MANYCYCGLCERNVVAVKKFNWTIFILSFFFFGIGWGIYLLYYVFKSGDICPICRNEHLLPFRNAPTEDELRFEAHRRNWQSQIRRGKGLE